jgi:hypothetical protein
VRKFWDTFTDYLFSPPRHFLFSDTLDHLVAPFLKHTNLAVATPVGRYNILGTQPDEYILSSHSDTHFWCFPSLSTPLAWRLAASDESNYLGIPTTTIDLTLPYRLRFSHTLGAFPSHQAHRLGDGAASRKMHSLGTPRDHSPPTFTLCFLLPSMIQLLPSISLDLMMAASGMTDRFPGR